MLAKRFISFIINAKVKVFSSGYRLMGHEDGYAAWLSYCWMFLSFIIFLFELIMIDVRTCVRF